jgi:antitoxin Phd
LIPGRKRAAERGTWQVQTAKAKFSELLRRAHAEGAQIVTKQGKDDVVVLPIEQYRKLTRRSRQPASLVQFFAQSPLADVDLNLERERDYGRGIEL